MICSRTPATPRRARAGRRVRVRGRQRTAASRLVVEWYGGRLPYRRARVSRRLGLLVVASASPRHDARCGLQDQPSDAGLTGCPRIVIHDAPQVCCSRDALFVTVPSEEELVAHHPPKLDVVTLDV